MDTFRRFPILDPQLPLRLLPAGWLRGPARERSPPSTTGWPTPPSGTSGRSWRGSPTARTPGVRAHTTADLLAGVCAAESRNPAPPAGSTDLAESSPSH